MTSFKLNYLFKGPIFNVVSHSLGYLGLGIQHMGQGGIIQSIMGSDWLVNTNKCFYCN